MNKRLIALACVAFGVAELLLVILSWLLSATRLEGVRSLISSEGIRWFVGEFTYTLASPLLVWLLLVLVALGCLQRSGLMSRGRGYRDRVALRVSLSFMINYICGDYLPAHPHASRHPALSHRLAVSLGLQSCAGTHHLLRGRGALYQLWYGIRTPAYAHRYSRCADFWPPTGSAAHYSLYHVLPVLCLVALRLWLTI